MTSSMTTTLLRGFKRHASSFAPMTSKHQWPRVNIGYTIKKPKLKRKLGRSRVQRIKASDEASTSKKRRECLECHELDHLAKNCQRGLTARQKRRLLSSENASEEPISAFNAGPSDTRGALPSGRSGRRGRGRSSSHSESSNAILCDIGAQRGKGRGGRGRTSSHTESSNAIPSDMGGDIEAVRGRGRGGRDGGRLEVIWELRGDYSVMSQILLLLYRLCDGCHF